MKNAGLLSSLILSFCVFSAHADPVTPVINGLIAPTGFSVPALPIPDAPGGVPGLPALPGLGGGAPGLPSGLPSELPGLGSLPPPGTGGGGAPGLPSLPTGALLPGSGSRDPITDQINAVLTPKTGFKLPGLFAPLFDQIPFTGLPSLTGEVIGLLGSDIFGSAYGELNYRKGELVYVVIEPAQVILAMSTDPALYQAALLRSADHLQNALLGRPGAEGGGVPGLPGLPVP